MQNLETQDWWPELLRHKDTLSLKQLAERFGTTAGAISAALRRVGDGRSVPSKTDDDDLPPEAGADESEPRRRGSKDALLFALMGKMGTVPDNEIAREAAVSLRTVASFRARHRISAYDGPRRRQAPTPAPSAAKSGNQAWLVSFQNGQDRVVLADSIQKVAETVGRTADVVKVSLVGPLL